MGKGGSDPRGGSGRHGDGSDGCGRSRWGIGRYGGRHLQVPRASVFVDGGAGEFAGAVNFRSVVKGQTAVDVFLSSEEPITCPDGTEDVRNETLRTEGQYSWEPGPVVLDVDPRLQTAHGEAVVNLVHSVAPGCGSGEVAALLPAQRVSVDFVGTSELIRARMSGSASAGNAFDRARVSSIARDGTGSAVVGAFVDADSDASWLKYAVEHFARRGTQPQTPENPAPEGRPRCRGGSVEFLRACRRTRRAVRGCHRGRDDRRGAGQGDGVVGVDVEHDRGDMPRG